MSRFGPTTPTSHNWLNIPRWRISGRTDGEMIRHEIFRHEPVYAGAVPRAQTAFHLIEQPIDGICSAGP
jgi:hypothetical protein